MVYAFWSSVMLMGERYKSNLIASIALLNACSHDCLIAG